MLCERKGKHKSPLVTRILIEPTTPATIPLRARIVQYAESQPFFVIVVEEPVARMAYSIEGSIDIQATISGTLGGFLKDQFGAEWGVTCGHVAQTIGTSITLPDVAGIFVPSCGVVRHSNFSVLSPTQQNSVCNQYLNSSHPSVDAALIELVNPHIATNSVRSIGTVTAVYARTQLNSGNVLAMRGAISGLNVFEIGAYGVTSRIELGGSGTYFCFSHLFEFSAPSSRSSWMPARVSQVVAPRPVQGDSGAWLCFDLSGGNYALFGSLVATRGATGVATFADSLIDWANQQCGGLQLSQI
jgi:hypothetical protein